jgi:hypothetical protein
MATIIDSLLVKLGIDSSEFDAGKNKVDKGLKNTGSEADKTGAKLKKTGKDGAEGFANVAASAAKFLALIGGTMAVKRFIEQTVESSAALDRLSKNLQENVSTVSAWSNAAEQAGGSAEGLQGTLDMLSKAQTELQLTGQSQLIPYFSALGVSVADASGKARSGADVMLDLADRFSKMDRTTANNMGRMMGIDQGTMNLLLKGRKEVELMVARQKEYSAVTKHQAEESSRLKLAMTESRQSFEAFGRELLSAAMPALEGLFSMMKDFGAWMRENKEFVNAFLTIIAVGLGAIAAATIPINLTVVAVGLLAAAIAALWQDYQTWKRGGDSFIDWSKWEPGFTAAGKGIKVLKDLIGDLVYRAIAAADVLSAVFNRDWKRAKFAAGEFMSGTGKKYGEEDPKPAAATPAPAGKPGVGGTVNSTGKSPAGGAAQEKAAMDYFQKQGWSKEQAAGLAANIKRESAFKADAVGDGGKAYGIAQWHPDRQAEFKKKFGKDIQGSSLEEQMAFMHHELTAGKEKGAGDKLRQATTAQDAAAAVSKHYERPADKEGEATKRGQLAAAMMGNDALAPTAPVQVASAPDAKPESYVDKREAAGAAPVAKSLDEDHTQGGRLEYNDLGDGVVGVKDKETGVYEAANEEQEKAYRKAQGAEYKRKLAEANDPNAYKPGGSLSNGSTGGPVGGIPGASQAAQGAGAAQVAQSNAPAPAQGGSNSVETHIGEVKVYTNADNADGIAKDMGKSLDYLFTSQANYGLT